MTLLRGYLHNVFSQSAPQSFSSLYSHQRTSKTWLNTFSQMPIKPNSANKLQTHATIVQNFLFYISTKYSWSFLHCQTLNHVIISWPGSQNCSQEKNTFEWTEVNFGFNVAICAPSFEDFSHTKVKWALNRSRSSQVL